MFPIVAIGGVISAVASVAKGVSWVSDKLSSAKGTTDGGSGDAKSATATQASTFDAVLAAQVAGQSMPVSAPTPPANVLPHQSGTDYGSLARVQAGMLAYNHVGEHRGHHGKPLSGAADDSMVAQA